MKQDRMKQLLSKLLNLKKTDYIAILLLGVLALVIALPVKSDKGQQAENTAESKSENETTDTAYEQILEEKLENILRDIDGVGKVKVMITLANDGNKSIDKDIKESTESTEKTTVIYEKDDESQPYIISSEMPQIQGVLVVAEGGGNPQVNNDISCAVQALFNVEAHKIKVAKMLS